jgi:hypothetical protein
MGATVVMRGDAPPVCQSAERIGKWNAARMATPDDVNARTVAASGLDSRSLSVLGLGRGAFSLGKRFRSSSETDVSLLIFVDTDAYSARPAWLFSGGGVNFQCTSPNGQVSNLKLGGGRDQAGGVGLFGVISLSPGK